MERTYWAVLHKGRLEWMGTRPEIDSDRHIEVKVVISEEQARSPVDSKKAAAALRELAESGAFLGIDDPVEWQREIRKDRPLPGRE